MVDDYEKIDDRSIHEKYSEYLQLELNITEEQSFVILTVLEYMWAENKKKSETQNSTVNEKYGEELPF